MKRFFITIVLAFASTGLFSQSFYRYQGKMIDLKVDSTMVVIQLDEQLVEKQNSAFEEKLQKGEIEFFLTPPRLSAAVTRGKLSVVL